MWGNLKAEILICLSNAEANLKAVGCTNRDFYAGKCLGLQEVLALEYKFTKEEFVKSDRQHGRVY